MASAFSRTRRAMANRIAAMDPTRRAVYVRTPVDAMAPMTSAAKMEHASMLICCVIEGTIALTSRTKSCAM